MTTSSRCLPAIHTGDGELFPDAVAAQSNTSGRVRLRPTLHIRASRSIRANHEVARFDMDKVVIHCKEFEIPLVKMKFHDKIEAENTAGALEVQVNVTPAVVGPPAVPATSPGQFTVRSFQELTLVDSSMVFFSLQRKGPNAWVGGSRDPRPVSSNISMAPSSSTCFPLVAHNHTRYALLELRILS